MRFMLDENVANSVAEALKSLGHEVLHVKDVMPTGSPDEAVAAAAEHQQAILITHDKDFKRVVSRVPNKQRAFFRNLSRILLCCDEWKAADRVEKSFSFVEHEFCWAKENGDGRMMLQIGREHIRSNR